MNIQQQVNNVQQEKKIETEKRKLESEKENIIIIKKIYTEQQHELFEYQKQNKILQQEIEILKLEKLQLEKLNKLQQLQIDNLNKMVNNEKQEKNKINKTYQQLQIIQQNLSKTIASFPRGSPLRPSLIYQTTKSLSSQQIHSLLSIPLTTVQRALRLRSRKLTTYIRFSRKRYLYSQFTEQKETAIKYFLHVCIIRKSK